MRMYSLDPLGKHFEHVVPIESNPKNLGLIDFIIVVGDNETLMDVIRQYCCMDTPPILAIGNGCGPGLYNYTKFQAKELTQIAIDNLMGNCLFTQQLMKITCNINCQTVGEAVCQIEIHRGMNQAVLTLNIYLENEEREKIKIGQLRGDGLLISTPSGSYCKSLCLNGPLMCKTMENIMITPICPLSMKFRPICLPSTSRIFIEVDSHCRSECAYIYFDENNQSAKLNKGDLMRIKMSKFKAKLISNLQ
jgi:NAD kinase